MHLLAHACFKGVSYGPIGRFRPALSLPLRPKLKIQTSAQIERQQLVEHQKLNKRYADTIVI